MSVCGAINSRGSAVAGIIKRPVISVSETNTGQKVRNDLDTLTPEVLVSLPLVWFGETKDNCLVLVGVFCTVFKICSVLKLLLEVCWEPGYIILV